VELTRKQAEKALKSRDSLIKLMKNREYKEVFEEGYFKNEAMRLPLALVDNEMQDETEQRILREKIAAIGHLHVYFNTVIALGNQVQASLEAEEREKIAAETESEFDEISGEEVETDEC